MALLSVLVLAAPAALAQDDPALDDEEMDTGADSPDDAYLDDEYGEDTFADEDPTLDDGDFDTNAPTPDDSYLDDEYDDGATGSPPEDSAPKKRRPVPTLGALTALAALGAVALGHRR